MDLYKRLQLNMKEAMDIVRDRQEWRHRISTSSLPLGWRASKKKKKAWAYVRILEVVAWTLGLHESYV